MSGAWSAVAHRGEFIAAIYTALRLQQDYRRAIPHPYLLIAVPDGGETFFLWFDTFEALRAWCREMQPRALGTHTAGHAHGEDADSLIALCRSGTVVH